MKDSTSTLELVNPLQAAEAADAPSVDDDQNSISYIATYNSFRLAVQDGSLETASDPSLRARTDSVREAHARSQVDTQATVGRCDAFDAAALDDALRAAMDADWEGNPRPQMSDDAHIHGETMHGASQICMNYLTLPHGVEVSSLLTDCRIEMGPFLDASMASQQATELQEYNDMLLADFICVSCPSELTPPGEPK